MAAVSAEVPSEKLQSPQNLVYLAHSKLFHRLNIIDTTPLLIHGRERVKKATLEEMGEIFGYKDIYTQRVLSDHSKRIKQYESIQLILLITLSFLFFFQATFLVLDFGIPAVGVLVDSIDRLSLNLPSYSLSPIKWSLSVILPINLWILYFLIPFAAAAKIVSYVTDKPYANSLTIWTTFCLLCQLHEDNDVLKNPDRRKAILFRLNDLANGIILHSLHYPSKDKENRLWIRKHFRHISQFIHLRERWVVASKETTLEDLRRDFLWLSEKILNCRYGDFNWPDSQQDASPLQGSQKSENSHENQEIIAGNRTAEMSDSGINRMVRAIFNLFGIVIPIGLLVYLISLEGKIGQFALDMDALSTLTLAWGLVGMDKLFNLGFTSAIGETIKGLKVSG